MRPTAIELFTAIYRGLLAGIPASDADIHSQERFKAAVKALDITHRRLAALENMMVLGGWNEQLSDESPNGKEPKEESK
jgi:hypothetical protein